MVNSMKKFKIIIILVTFLLTLGLTTTASAQTYRFVVTDQEVEAYLNEDGTLTLRYLIEFLNDEGVSSIDFVDIALPSTNYSLSSVEADIDGIQIDDIEKSPYVDGIALGLGKNAIPAGDSGIVTVWIVGIRDVLFPYDQGDKENYVNFQFSPNWFDSQYDKSSATKYRVTIILPPGVKDDEGTYYYPEYWPGSDIPDEAGLTQDDRVYYSWYTENADAHSQYIFGCAFPQQYVPDDSVIVSSQPSSSSDNISAFNLWNIIGDTNPCCCGMGGFLALIFGWVLYQVTVGTKKRKLKYLPPKISIEGHGIKRGLTAVEAAIIMEEPMDKIFSMILFGTLKKSAASVIEREPLKLKVADPLPEGLHLYETEFLEAFKQNTAAERRKALQGMMINLVKSTSKKMKGFSRKETIAYYKDIMLRAWKMVEEANTPELKSESFDRTLEWTMLDEDFNDRTKRTFTGMPVFVPIWWNRYDPAYRSSTMGISRSRPATSVAGGSKGSISLPHIPGSDFAASVVNGTTGMAAGVIGSVAGFTSGVTNRTNPIPTSTTRSGSSGFRGGGSSGRSSCACACACAGCACACAGGGR